MKINWQHELQLFTRIITIVGALVLGLWLLQGCAASPDVMILVDKRVMVLTDGDVMVEYQSDSKVDSDAELRGEVNPPITVVPTVPGL